MIFSREWPCIYAGLHQLSADRRSVDHIFYEGIYETDRNEGQDEKKLSNRLKNRQLYIKRTN
jgi:hypothetical protein